MMKGMNGLTQGSLLSVQQGQGYLVTGYMKRRTLFHNNLLRKQENKSF